MPQTIFLLEHDFPSKEDFLSWKLDQNYSWAVENTTRTRCTLCKQSYHKMKTQYARCNNTDCNANGECPRRYKIIECLKDGGKHRVRFLKRDDHASENLEAKHHGMTTTAKNLIEEIIYHHGYRAKQIAIRLSKKKYKGNNNIRS